MQQSYKQKSIGLFLLLTFLFGNFSAFSQTRKTNSGQTAAATSKKEEKAECKGGYSGIVSYNRTVKTNSSGKFGSTYSKVYTYQSNIIIRDDGTTQGTIYKDYNGIGGSFNFTGKATATLTENLNDLQATEKDDFCSLSMKGGQNKTRVRCESLLNRQTNAQGSGDVNVFLSFKGNKYKISLDNPRVSGQVSQTSKSSCSGTCNKNEPINHSRTDAINNEKQNGNYTDDVPFDPNNFNRLSGTFTRTSGDETVTITWSLSRCSPPLQINSLAFEHHQVPDPTTWRAVDSLSGTTDGNLVKVRAKVFNNGGETAYATVKFSEVSSGEKLPDGEVSVAVKPGEARDVEYEWDTSGYAWDESQKPKSNREIKAEIEGGKESVTEKIKILPKPVIMAHGLWSNAGAWAEYPGFLREAHSFAWNGYAVGSDPKNGKMNTGEHPGNYKATNTIYQNAQELGKQIKFARETHNAWHVDIVAHSMGGLISRQYINTFMKPVFDGKPEVTHLVMLGTPNMGSPCADTVTALFEEFNQNGMHAMRELRPIIVRAFNARINDRKGVKFSILIGLAMPRTCLDDSEWSDGVVPLSSAKYNNTDFRYVARDHISLTGKTDFLGFVMPRLAIGPKKAKAEQATAFLDNQTDESFALNEDFNEQNDRYGFNKYFQKASYKRQKIDRNEYFDDDKKDENITTKQKIELKAKEVKEIEIPVSQGVKSGVLLVASTAIVATLKDQNGTVIGESKGGLDAIREIFRTISVDKPIQNCVLKLKLENFGNEATTVFVAGLAINNSGSSFTVEVGKSNSTGIISLQAKWMENNSAILNAKIVGKIVGESSEIIFYDDGKHNDGAANDGVYGASTEKLANGEYFIEVKAEAGNQMKFTVLALNIGNASQSAKPSSKAVKKK